MLDLLLVFPLKGWCMHKKFLSSAITAVSVTSLLLVSGCYKPERVEETSPRDASLNCQQIQMEKRRAEQAKAAAREHDQFEFRYILIVPAVVSLYNFDKAEKAANARLEQLDRLYMQKDCANQKAQPMSLPNNPSGMGMPQNGGMMMAPSPFNPDDEAPDPFGRR